MSLNRASGTAFFEINSNNNSLPVMTVTGKGTSDIFQVIDNITPVLVVKDGGNVGIGTTSPSAKLDVNNNTSVSSSGQDTLRVGASIALQLLVLDLNLVFIDKIIMQI